MSQFSLEELIPHREPMLLLDDLVSVSDNSAVSKVVISKTSSFFNGVGVPAWIGLEYMGQTAALIAGYRIRMGETKPLLGFLLGSREFETRTGIYSLNQVLQVKAQESTTVGENLATFNCTISNFETSEIIAKANLSVFREAR